MSRRKTAGIWYSAKNCGNTTLNAALIDINTSVSYHRHPGKSNKALNMLDLPVNPGFIRIKAFIKTLLFAFLQIKFSP